jgi:formylglycine-generating enzyme
VNKLTVMVMVLLAAIFVFTGCDDKGKTSIIPIGGGRHAAGDIERFYTNGVGFNMAYVPGKKFFTGTDDSGQGEVINDYWIGETEVPVYLWFAVRVWATTDAGSGLRADGGELYYILNAGGTAGASDLYPVALVSWDDCMVWCNALTEWYNYFRGTKYTCVYRSGGVPIRDSRTANYSVCHSVVPDASATGFRLLTGDEWELAARYIEDADNDGDIRDTGEYYPGNYMSGASVDYSNGESVLVAWYTANSGGDGHPVMGLSSNALGLYDMSGNLTEWCEDHFHGEPDRLIRGGCYLDANTHEQVGYKVDYSTESIALAAVGFRIGKNK